MLVITVPFLGEWLNVINASSPLGGLGTFWVRVHGLHLENKESQSQAFPHPMSVCSKA